jgi:hypothetical protein
MVLKKIIISALFFICFLSSIFTAEKGVKNDLKAEQGVKNDIKAQYAKEKITFVFKEEFDVLYPLNTNTFTFYQGEKRLTLDEFVKLSDDPLLKRNQKKINNVKIAGFTTAGIFGTMFIATMIPAVIFIVKQTNSNPVDQTYVISGVVTMAISLASFAGMFIDLIITFSLLYNFKYSVQAVRQAVERYNENIQNKLGIIPDMSYNDQKLNFTFTYKY